MINLIKGHQIVNLRMSDAKMEGWQEMTLGNREAGSNMSFRAFKLLSWAEDEVGAAQNQEGWRSWMSKIIQLLLHGTILNKCWSHYMHSWYPTAEV